MSMKDASVTVCRDNGTGTDKKKGEDQQEDKRRPVHTAEKCFCPNCGASVNHRSGVSCMIHICPQCGSQMMND